MILIREPLMVTCVLLLIVIGKSLVALGIVLGLGYPLSTALTVSASLAQIGEFSFILAGLGITYGLMEKEGLNLVLAGALFSITLNPVVFTAVDRLIRRVQANPQLRRQFEEARGAHFATLKQDLDFVRGQAQEKAAAHKTFTPEELADRFPLFEGLSPEQREVLVLHFEPHTAQPGDRIIRAGDKADSVYFIVDGQVEVGVGDRRIKLGPGDFFGEMALISGLPRAADVTALDYSKFATLSRRDFQQFLARYPAVRDHVAALASKRREMNRHLASENA
jgi:CPA2 family monovalent cation:H+ antiporter-2